MVIEWQAKGYSRIYDYEMQNGREVARRGGELRDMSREGWKKPKLIIYILYIFFKQNTWVGSVGLQDRPTTSTNPTAPHSVFELLESNPTV